MNNQILSRQKINDILKRIAFQIVENNFAEEEIYLIGIVGQGVSMARELQQMVVGIRPGLRVSLQELTIDKANPIQSDIRLDIDLSALSGGVAVLIDDVMNTGRTTSYALSYLLQVPLKKVETAVLVNRQYTRFPISVTYSGFGLSTTPDEHIEVRLEGEVGAYLY